MTEGNQRTRSPGTVRDAIIGVLAETPEPLTSKQVHERVCQKIGETPASSVRSYLQNNRESVFNQVARGKYTLQEPLVDYRTRELLEPAEEPACFETGKARMIQQDCLAWLERAPACSVHAVVTDPPYGLVEYSRKEQDKLKAGRGGV